MAGYIGGFAGKMLGSACLNIKFGNDDELGDLKSQFFVQCGEETEKGS